MDVLGVHGIAQRGQRDLSVTWTQALSLGWPDDAGVPPRVDVPYLSRLLDRRSGHLGDDAPLEPGEAEFLWQAAREQLGVDDEALDRLLVERAPLGTLPHGLVAAAGAVDERLGAVLRLTGPVWPGTLREVYRYLRWPDVREGVRHELFQFGERPDPDLVIGHSLGSVVAYDVAVHGGPVRQLVTIGSPLGLRTVREHPTLLEGAGPVPVTWVNVYDPADVVAGGRALVAFWPQVRDIVVDNGRDAHGARRYLAQPQVGAAVASLLRPAEPRREW